MCRVIIHQYVVISCKAFPITLIVIINYIDYLKKIFIMIEGILLYLKDKHILTLFHPNGRLGWVRNEWSYRYGVKLEVPRDINSNLLK